MKVTVEFSDRLAAMKALQGDTYLEFIEEFDTYLSTTGRRAPNEEIIDKWAILKDLYKI